MAGTTKLRYLKPYLKKVTKELVRDVQGTIANYLTTWASLQARYNNPQLLVFKNFQILMDIPQLRRENTIDMRSFADEAQRIIRALANMPLPVQHWDLWFVSLLIEKLDTESRKIWEADVSDRKHCPAARSDDTSMESRLARLPTFSEFDEFFERRIQSRSMMVRQHS